MKLTGWLNDVDDALCFPLYMHDSYGVHDSSLEGSYPNRRDFVSGSAE